jgi:coenzyme PQQ precursor peptide PqqA
MNWSTPAFTEISASCEINTYAAAEICWAENKENNNV